MLLKLEGFVSLAHTGSRTVSLLLLSCLGVSFQRRMEWSCFSHQCDSSRRVLWCRAAHLLSYSGCRRHCRTADCCLVLRLRGMTEHELQGPIAVPVSYVEAL